MRNTRCWRTVTQLFFLFWLECAEPGPNTALLFTPSSWMCFLEVEAPTHRKISQMDGAQTPGLQRRMVTTTLHYDQLYFSTLISVRTDRWTRTDSLHMCAAPLPASSSRHCVVGVFIRKGLHDYSFTSQRIAVFS